MRQVYLIGFMGAGKSTVGRIVAGRLGMPFVDLDESIEESSGATIAEIFDAQGEAAFREMESAELVRVAHGPASVVACGGGVVLSDENRRVLKDSGCVLYLKVAAEVAMARIGGAESRPLLAGKSGEVAAEILDARRSTYESMADAVVDTTSMEPGTVADSVESAVENCARCCDE